MKKMFFNLSIGFLSVASVAHACGCSYGKGLVSPTQEELDYMEKNRVTAVLPNKIGAARMKIELEKAGTSKGQDIVAVTTFEEEFERDPEGKNPFASALPSSVDNSTLPCFPAIGNQGALGSCVAWATTYYQATHEVGLVKGFNNKTSSANVLSPKWTYNMINSGQDGGSYISDGYSLLSQNGAATWAQFPYDSNYQAWDLQAQDWITALSYRTTPYVGLGGLSYSPQNLTAIKQALVNGHVLTFGTYIDSWVFTKIQSNFATQNKYVGQQACSWVSGWYGSHLITVVGYDDSVWIDVNGNGQVDPGEMGAFLVANSWGPFWGNQGFMWISYDAFLQVSAVPNGPTQNRMAAAAVSNSMFLSTVAKTNNYNPKVVAQFNLGQTQRNQIKIATGLSDTAHTVPSRYFMSGAVNYQGGALEFDGTTSATPENGTFTLDLTDLVVSGTDPQRFYFMVVDNAVGNPTLINSLSLMDLVYENTISLSSIPSVVDQNKVTAYVDYAFPVSTAAVKEKPVAINLSSVRSGDTIQGTVALFASTDGPIESVQFYLDSQLLDTVAHHPYFYLLDTTSFPNGAHDLSAVGSGQADQMVTSKVRVRIQN